MSRPCDMSALPADRRGLALRDALAGEISVRERAAIARKTDSAPPHAPCPYCLDFNPADPAHAGVSHHICATCNATLTAQLDTIEASR